METDPVDSRKQGDNTVQKLPVCIIEHFSIRQFRIINTQISVQSLIRIQNIHDRTVRLEERLQALRRCFHILLHILIAFFLQDPAGLGIIIGRDKNHGKNRKHNIDKHHFLKEALILKPSYDIHSASPHSVSRRSG